MTPEPEELQYATSNEGNLAILRALNEIAFLERMRPLMTEVAKILIKAGVDFSRCREPVT